MLHPDLFGEVLPTLYAHSGDNIFEAAKDTVKLAAKLKQTVVLNFNGVELICYPDTTAEKLSVTYLGMGRK